MGVPVSNDGPESKKEQEDEPLPNSAVDAFFVKMKHDFRRPKPSDEAVAVALQAIQKITGEAALEHNEANAFPHESGDGCPRCGAVNSGANRFCGYCGALLGRTEKAVTKPEVKPEGAAGSSAQHIYHHHYHHHYFLDSQGKALANIGSSVVPAGNAPLAPPSEDTSDAETAIQKLVQDWSVFCNSKRLDDLVALYSADAIVLRPNEAPAHGCAAIRQLLEADLQAGLGDVDLECADTGIVGEIACLTGRCKMLVPIAAAKRTEQTGKYLMVARRERGEWKIVADSWSMDTTPRISAPANAAVLPMRAPRK